MKKERTVELGTQTLRYTLRKRRGQKKLSLSVRADGAVSLAVPWWVSAYVAERYLQEKRDWIQAALQEVSQSHMGADECAKQYAKHKEAARTFVQERLPQLNQHYGYVWGRVAIRKNTSCWGSCSSKKNLNFDFRILFLPPHLQDYLLVHELCHLQEMNHSKRFWALVARAVPEHEQCRKALKQIQR